MLQLKCFRAILFSYFNQRAQRGEALMKSKNLFLIPLSLSLFIASAAFADNEVYDSSGRLTSYTDNGLTYSYAYDIWGYVYETVSGGGSTENNCYYSWWDVENNNDPAGTFTETTSNGQTTRTLTIDDGDGYGWTVSSVFNSSGQNISMSYEDTYSDSSSTETMFLNNDGTWTDTYKTYYYEGDGDNRYISTVNENNDQFVIDQDQNWNNVSSTYSRTEYYEGGQQVAYSESGSSTYDENGNETGTRKEWRYGEDGLLQFVGEESGVMDQNGNDLSYTFSETEYYEGTTQVAFTANGSASYDEYGNEIDRSIKGLEYDEDGQAVYIRQEASNGMNFEGEIEYENGIPVVNVSGGNYNQDFNRECPDGSGWSGCQYTSAYQLDSNFDVTASQTVVTDQNGDFIWKQEVSENDGVMTFAEYDVEDATTPSAKYMTYLNAEGFVTENLDPETGAVISTSLAGSNENGAYVLNYNAQGQLESFEQEGRLYSLNSQGQLNMFQSCAGCLR